MALSAIIVLTMPMPVYATATVGETIILDGGSAQGANYGSETGHIETETGDGGSYGGRGGGSYVRPDNANEAQFQSSKRSIQSIIQGLIARAEGSSTANVNYGDILHNGSTVTMGFVQPSFSELQDMISNADSMFMNTSRGDPSISNRYEGSLTGGSLGAMPSLRPSPPTFTDAYYEYGEGANVDENGNIIGDGSGSGAANGRQSIPNGSAVGSYPGITDTDQTGGFSDIDGFLRSRNMGGDIADFQNGFLNQFNLQNGGSSSALYQINADRMRSLFLGLDENGNFGGNLFDYRFNQFPDYMSGIRSDLFPGGFSIAPSWEDRFRDLSIYNGPIAEPPVFGLLTEYRVSDIRTNDRTNIEFIPNTRYWSIDRPDGTAITARTEDPYLIFTPQQPGLYNFRCSQEAVYTVRTLLTITRSQYLFDTNTGSIFYFRDQQLSPYSLGATQQRRYIPTRGYTVTVNELGEFETTEDDNMGVVERIE